jgi:hypothetical protein
MATRAGAQGKIRRARNRKEQGPTGWINDKDGFLALVDFKAGIMTDKRATVTRFYKLTQPNGLTKTEGYDDTEMLYGGNGFRQLSYSDFKMVDAQDRDANVLMSVSEDKQKNARGAVFGKLLAALANMHSGDLAQTRSDLEYAQEWLSQLIEATS